MGARWIASDFIGRQGERMNDSDLEASKPAGAGSLGWDASGDAFVTSCCGSDQILQDAYADPIHPDEVVSVFDSFVCDNGECSRYGSACSFVRFKDWQSKA